MFRTGLAAQGKSFGAFGDFGTRPRRALYKWGVAVAVALSGVAGGPLVSGAQARDAAEPAAQVQASAPLDRLPAEAQDTYRRVLEGGPFPYAKDGITFGNRERLLPSKRRGYYREYTVKTPGARDRGARRIVCGGAVAPSPDTCYYTDDHYASFRRIVK